MRDPERIEPFLAKFAELWRRHPDQRFGQLLMNLCRPGGGEPGFLDPWNWEESTWEKKIREYQQIVDSYPLPVLPEALGEADPLRSEDVDGPLQ